MIHRPQTAPAPPFAIGGLGGSGTRATAMLVRNCGCWLGEDLNDALDNLWFTLLFKRASVLTDTDARLEDLFTLFQARMQGESPRVDPAEMLANFASSERAGHTAEWLKERLQSLLAAPAGRPEGMRWGWKEPNTHIIIERLLRLAPGLKYVHVVRNPFYMASSKNRNQLINWGQVFLDRDLSGSLRDALAFWVAIHKRLEALDASYPGRILFFSHDRFMADPEPEAKRLLEFLNLEPPADGSRLYEDILFRPDSPPDKADAMAGADADDLAYCKAFAARFL
jgi:hypothetical protein